MSLIFLVRAKERMDMDDNERMAKLIQEQIERGAKAEKNLKETEYTELKRTDEDEKGELLLIRNCWVNFCQRLILKTLDYICPCHTKIVCKYWT